MAEILEESNEINEVLGQSYGIGDEMDEDELLGGRHNSSPLVIPDSRAGTAELDMLGEMDLGVPTPPRQHAHHSRTHIHRGLATR
jgi:hypothetical protein